MSIRRHTLLQTHVCIYYSLWTEAFRSNFTDTLPFVVHPWKMVEKHKMQMWIFAIHPHHLVGWCMCACVLLSVCVCVQGACICAHDTPRLSASSKALSGALCGPRSLPFHSPSFCLSVSYLIELAQKQSKDRYLRLRAKAYWCLGEVSSLPPSVCFSLSVSLSHDPFKRVYEQQIKGMHNDVPLFCQVHMVVETLPPFMHKRTHLPTFKQVYWLIIDTYMEWQREENWVQILSFGFISAHPLLIIHRVFSPLPYSLRSLSPIM